MPGINIGKDGNIIRATITNKSSEPQYIISCKARGTYSFRQIAMTHIRKPFIPPRLYSNVRYGGFSYDLMKQNNLKIEPLQPTELTHKLSDHPLSAVHTPYFIIEVQLSSGHTIKSSKMYVPKFWCKIGLTTVQNKSPNNANTRGRLKASRKKRATLLTAGDLRR